MIKAHNIVKSYFNGKVETQVLRGIDLQIDEGEFVAIIGPSGAGKSTLMYQLSLLDHPTSGEIIIDNDHDTAKMSKEERTYFRLMELGYVFQDYALLPDLTAWENVAVPLLMQGKNKSEAKEIAINMLGKVGLKDRAKNLPSQMSGGEQQRVSIARAIAHKPKILFADEPTANLDTKTSTGIVQLFKDLNSAGQTIVMVTHEMEFASQAKRIVEMKDGVIIKDRKVSE